MVIRNLQSGEVLQRVGNCWAIPLHAHLEGIIFTLMCFLSRNLQPPHRGTKKTEGALGGLSTIVND